MKKEVNPVLKPASNIWRIYAIGFMIIAFCVLLTILGFFIIYWFKHNQVKVQPPIVFQTPIWIEEVKSPEEQALKSQLVEVQQRLEAMEASEAARPSDAPIVNKFVQQSDISILKKNSIR